MSAEESLAPPTRRSAGQRRANVIYVAVGCVLSLLFVGPLVLAVIRSLQTEAQIVQPPNANSFDGLSLENYLGIFTRLPFLEMLGNSLIVSLGSAVVTAVIATLAGYGLGRFTFRGQSVVFGVILLALMVPFQVLFTPIYLQFNALGLTDSRIGLIIFYVTFNLPFAVFIMRNTFAAMPRELEEAAYVDGASTMGTLIHVLRPLALPGVATVVIFTFLACWTEFLGAFLFLTSQDKQTLPVGLLTLIQGGFGGISFGYVIAGSVISLIPCVILFIALQRYYVQGLAAGSVKN
ncbi:carbohydrate ABC transporter permease [Microbacterium sulfonylureivorans]|uniref:carbohydrate ABC transporter permease n=1 Tax=Microbacterium sulfonylureivorans TaxID=2486854 RepID=UPI000FDB7600|nr:carbohydrate ABC transporter permease [Microbacterium sulfonylureivorans]